MPGNANVIFSHLYNTIRENTAEKHIVCLTRVNFSIIILKKGLNNMIRRFNVKNFMSFSCTENGTSEEFSMIPGKVRSLKDHLCGENKDLLKFAGIYGANASGKSNLIKAMSCMRNIIMKNSTEGYYDKYSKIGKENANKPSYFEMEIVLDNRRYSYGFEVILKRSRFVSEWLVEFEKNDEENVIFERDIDKDKFEINEVMFDLDTRSRLEIYLEDAENSLFLYLMNQNKEKFYKSFPEGEIFRRIYDWFDTKLNITEPDKLIFGYAFLTNEEKIDKAVRILKSFGTGIKDVKKEEISFEEILKKLSDQTKEDLFNAIDKNQKINLEFDRNHLDNLKYFFSEEDYSKFEDMCARNEGNGIKKLADAIIEKKPNEVRIQYHKMLDNYNKILETINKICVGIRTKNEFFLVRFLEYSEISDRCLSIKLLHSDDNEFTFGEESDGTQRLWDLLEVLITDEASTFVIDEIDRCMHPSLTYRFIKTFFEFTKNRNVQLIVTTHESRLLDFDLLRRDEIWFVDKRENGSSDIYSLEEYNERFDKKIDKAYLEGRYGGVPVFTSLFPVEEENK